MLRELIWDGLQTKDISVLATNQTVTATGPDSAPEQYEWRAGVEIMLDFVN
jgi:hypothetical protein